jgi:periplasmic divalent cation tolerance protein
MTTPEPKSEARLILTTTGSIEAAQRIAHALVEQKLAACVNLIPNLTSIYHWQGATETASEVLLLIKTTTQHLRTIESTLRQLHAYEVPEFLVLPIESGSQPYLDWLSASVSSQNQKY